MQITLSPVRQKPKVLYFCSMIVWQNLHLILFALKVRNIVWFSCHALKYVHKEIKFFTLIATSLNFFLLQLFVHKK